MQRSRRERRHKLANMSEPDTFVYKPPAQTNEIVYPVRLGNDHELTVRQNLYREYIVDFAVMHRFEGEEWPAEVHRVDCCHGEVHSHQFFRRREQERTSIAVIPREKAWETVDAHFQPCHDRVLDGWEQNFERWRSA